MTKPANQQLLGLVAPGRTIGVSRFQAETLRRGGPLEVQGIRQRAGARLAARVMAERHGEAARPLLGAHLLRRMR